MLFYILLLLLTDYYYMFITYVHFLDLKFKVKYKREKKMNNTFQVF